MTELSTDTNNYLANILLFRSVCVTFASRKEIVKK